MKIEKAGKEIIEKIASDWNADKAAHLHFKDGFSFVAKEGVDIVGFISGNLNRNKEFLIDIIDVKAGFRRQGIASELIRVALEEAKAKGAIKVRSWSSIDKEAAIAMWKALGFEMISTTQISSKTHKPVAGYVVTKEL